MRDWMKRAVMFVMALVITAGLAAPAKASAETDVTITESMQVTDTLNGVDTWYRPGGNDGSDKTYCCAAYVKRYYEEIYGITLRGMIGQVVPNVTNSSDYLVETEEPQTGDIIRERTLHGTTHWAIVKEVTEDGEVIAIEQNWKFRRGGSTVARVDRVMDEERCEYFRLHSVDLEVQESQAEILDAINAAIIQ